MRPIIAMERQRIVLNPMQKYIKYNHFPWKPVLHLILLLLTFIEVYIVIQ